MDFKAILAEAQLVLTQVFGSVPLKNKTNKTELHRDLQELVQLAEPIVMWGWAGLVLLFLLAWACGMQWESVLVMRAVMRWHLKAR